MSSDVFPASLLPRAGQTRAWWRMPASASALAWTIARVARAHAGPLLAVARDNQSAHQLEQDLRTLIPGALVGIALIVSGVIVMNTLSHSVSH